MTQPLTGVTDLERLVVPVEEDPVRRTIGNSWHESGWTAGGSTTRTRGARPVAAHPRRAIADDPPEAGCRS